MVLWHSFFVYISAKPYRSILISLISNSCLLVFLSKLLVPLKKENCRVWIELELKCFHAIWLLAKSDQGCLINSWQPSTQGLSVEVISVNYFLADWFPASKRVYVNSACPRHVSTFLANQRSAALNTLNEWHLDCARPFKRCLCLVAFILCAPSY